MMDSPWSKARVVVAGGHGFIGSHFVRELAELGAVVVSLYRTPQRGLRHSVTGRAYSVSSHQVDLLDSRGVRSIVGDAPVGADVLISCAALDGNATFKVLNGAAILDANVRLTLSVLELARAWRIPDVVLVSSAEVYSEFAVNPLKEEDDYRVGIDDTASGYVMSKVFTEIAGSVYRKKYGLRVYCPRPTNVYGPGDYAGRLARRVIPSMIGRALNGLDIEVWGDGSQLRSFVHVQDLVRSVLTMVEHGAEGPVNVGTREAVSMRDLASLVVRIFGGTGRVVFQASMPFGAGSRILDVGRLYSILAFQPRSLVTGLEEMAQSAHSGESLY